MPGPTEDEKVVEALDTAGEPPHLSELRHENPALNLALPPPAIAPRPAPLLKSAVPDTAAASSAVPRYVLERFNNKGAIPGYGEGGFFEIKDPEGKAVGSLSINVHGGDTLYVNWVAAGQNPVAGKPNFLGAGNVIGLKEQLKKEFPDAKYISGFRISGARKKAGAPDSKRVIRIPLSEITDEQLAQFIGSLG